MDKKTIVLLSVILALVIAVIVMGSILKSARESASDALTSLSELGDGVDELEASIRERDRTIANLGRLEDKRSEYYSKLEFSITQREAALKSLTESAGKRQATYNRIQDLIDRGRELSYSLDSTP